MGRAYRYQRRIAHIEMVLAERGKNGEGATVVGGETGCGAGEGRRRAPAAKAAGKKKKAAAKKKFQQFAWRKAVRAGVIETTLN